ncbi:MAG: hypothetical protein WDO19_02285 [Bacteroidota bacterium]
MLTFLISHTSFIRDCCREGEDATQAFRADNKVVNAVTFDYGKATII